MDSRVEELVREPILLTEAVRKAIEEVDSHKQYCAELDDKLEKLVNLIRTYVRLFSHGSGSLYDHPARRIMLELSKSLEKALVLVKKCKRSSVLRRVMNMISLSDFRKVNSALEGAIGDVTWLLNASAHRLNGKRGGMEGLPPIASTDPMLAWVWCQVALVHGGNPAEKEEGASYLASLASDNDRNRKIIIEEGGVPPLLRLLKEGTSVSGRIAAANAIGVLAVDTQRVQHICDCGACPVFVHILQDGPMKVQAKIAWLIGKMLARAPEAQDAFATESIIRPLVSLLVFETMDSNPTHKTLRSITMHNLSRGSPTSMSPSGEGKAGRTPMKSVRSVKLDDRWDAQSINSELNSDRPCGSPDVFAATKETKRLPIRHSRGFSDSYYFQGISSRELLRKERDNEDPETKHDLKVQVTFALWKLAENNVDSCRKIADTKALICLAKLIESEKDGDIVRNSVMTVMEIAAAAERSVELRRSAFKTTLPAAKAVVDQLLRMIEEGDWDLRLPCLRAVGCLSRTFPARETKVIGPLVHQLSHTELGIAGEAAQALQKFAQTDNFLHLEHSKAIVDAGALPHLVRLVSSEDKDVQMPALMLLCYLSMNAGNNEVFRETATLKVLKGLLRTSVCQIQAVNEILPAAMQHLELYQSARHSFRSY